MTAVTYQRLVEVKAQDSSTHLDILWKTVILFASPRPAWSGMSLGHLMVSTGLQDLLELIYVPNAVVHKLSGKAIAVRGHFTVDVALKALMLVDALNVPLPQRTNGPDGLMSEREELTEDGSDLPHELDKEWNEDLDKAAALFKSLMKGDLLKKLPPLMPSSESMSS